MKIARTVRSPRSCEDVFTYLADFTTTTEWDPGTLRTTRIDGDGGVGTSYHNVSRFRGRTTELVYTVVEHQPPRLLRLRGENRTVVALDTITLGPRPTGGCDVTYQAEFTFKGLAVLATPFLRRALARLGEEAEAGLRRALE